MMLPLINTIYGAANSPTEPRELDLLVSRKVQVPHDVAGQGHTPHARDVRARLEYKYGEDQHIFRTGK